MYVGILFYTHKSDFKKRENIGTEIKRVINGALTRITNFIFVIHFTQSTLKYEKVIGTSRFGQKKDNNMEIQVLFLKNPFTILSRKLNYDKCITSL